MPKTFPVSPLAPARFPDLPVIAGTGFATARAGFAYEGRDDVLIVAFDPGTVVAGTFTRSKCPSAPVDWCKAHLAGGHARALVVNAGNANAFTGARGQQATRTTADIAAKALGCAPEEVFLSSTGVIGEPLDAQKFAEPLDGCATRLAPGPTQDAARAIMTTDTFAKAAGRTVDLDGVGVNLAGIAKGSGMIAPDMATMLAYVFTDAAIAAPVLQQLLREGVGPSFNAITVDSDTSTSDTVLAFATGKAAMAPITELSDPRARKFAAALDAVLFDLAMQIVRDGEGATKFVAITVTGATSDQSAKTIARAIAQSPLVKTAIAGEDANWGRIVMAVGKAGEPADRDRLTISVGDLVLAKKGARSPAHDEAKATAYMKRSDIAIGVDLGLGNGHATLYTCDLTHGYIDINGSYRS